MRERQLDGRLAGHVERIARWWTSASQEEKFALLQRATKEGTPPLDVVRLAIILSESEAGQVTEG